MTEQTPDLYPCAWDASLPCTCDDTVCNVTTLRIQSTDPIVSAEDQYAALLAEVERLRVRVGQALSLCNDWDANGNSRPLGDPTADTWHEAARCLRATLGEDR